MPDPKKHKKKLIKEKDAQNLEIYNFFSFDERRELEEKIRKLENKIEEQQKLFLEQQSEFDRQILQKDIDFREILETEKQNSYNQGLSAGETSGFSKGEESVITAVKYLKKCGMDIIALKDKFLNEAETTVINLSVQIAKKIIASEISTNRDIIIQTIHKAINLISDRSQILLKLNETELESVKKKIPELKKEFDDVEKIVIETDVRIGKGGTIIETNSGIIDARIETQVEEIFTALYKSSKDKREDEEII